MQLVEASEDERRSRDALTASAWGTALTTQQFLEREQRLRAHPFARTTMKTWLWRKGTRVLSSCETFELEAVRGTRHGKAYVVASVFTEHTMRGRGHAVAMLEALVRHVSAPWTLALVLFSEVGAKLYERCGFVEQRAFDVVWPANAGKAEVTWLDEPLAPEFISTTVEPRPLPTVAMHGPLPLVDDVRLITTAAQSDWHIAREKFYASALNRRAAEHHVAQHGTSRLAVAAAFQASELHVLWYEFHDERDIEPLFTACASLAAALGLKRVRLWETTPFRVPPFAARARRTDELPMIHPIDTGPARWADITRTLWA